VDGQKRKMMWDNCNVGKGNALFVTLSSRKYWHLGIGEISTGWDEKSVPNEKMATRTRLNQSRVPRRREPRPLPGLCFWAWHPTLLRFATFEGQSDR
jgi:hypothetical protein